MDTFWKADLFCVWRSQNGEPGTRGSILCIPRADPDVFQSVAQPHKPGKLVAIHRGRKAASVPNPKVTLSHSCQPWRLMFSFALLASQICPLFFSMCVCERM